jgi:uncharacterized membrane protein YfcA
LFDTLDPATLATIAGALILAGVAIGFLAGLFGVGGGAISVPVFFEVFRIIGLDDGAAMPLAVGTSLAMIIPTAILSAREHARRGTVDTALLKAWILPVLAGVAAGTIIARYAEPAVFQAVFVLVATVNATKLLIGNPKWQLRETMPGPVGTSAYGMVVGLLSALMGVGGGAISNIIMTLNGKAIHEAVATSAAVGVLIAVPGTIGYMLAGWGQPGLSADALGYVSPLAVALTLPTALLFTRLGVRLAHRLSRKTLGRLFGIFLLAVAARFLSAILLA